MVPNWAFRGLANVTDGTSIVPCVAHVGLGVTSEAPPRDYHAAIGEIIIKYNGTLERYSPTTWQPNILDVLRSAINLQKPTLFLCAARSCRPSQPLPGSSPLPRLPTPFRPLLRHAPSWAAPAGQLLRRRACAEGDEGQINAAPMRPPRARENRNDLLGH
jgi:hypothetical protein